MLAPYGEAAAQASTPRDDEQAAVLGRKIRLAGLALSLDDGPAPLVRAADRMLAPASLGRRPAGDQALASLDPARLALALLLPLDADQRQALALALGHDHPNDTRGGAE